MLNRLTMLVALLAYPLAAQIISPSDVMEQYVLRQEKTLAAGVYGITVQQPSEGGNLVLFVGATAYCDGAYSAEVAIDGTAATTTAGTEIPVGGNRAAATAEGYTDSNLSGGTILLQQTLGSAGHMSWDLQGVTLPQGASDNRNLTLRISSNFTGDCRLQIAWREEIR